MEAIFCMVGVGFAAGLVAWLVIWSSRKNNEEYAKLWGRIAGLVNGTSKGSRMTGTYQGAPIIAEIRSVSDDNERTYYYELSTTPGGRGQDWSARYGGEKLFGFGEQRWHVRAKDDALKDRLVAARVVELMAVRPQHGEAKYRAKQGTLVYQETVGSSFDVPTPEEFKAHLELLARLADANRQANI
jgi:hypothetical protein